MFTAAKPVADSAARVAGESHRDRAAKRSRKQSAAAAEIGPPPPRDDELWNRYRFDLPKYLEENFPESTGLSPLSTDHLKIIKRTQETIFEGGSDLYIVYRGFAKSTLLENSITWAVGYGHCEFFVPLGATKEMAAEAMASIMAEFETNDRLMLIFPEVCHAARAIAGVPQRAKKQTINGQLTHICWSTKRCVLPTVPGFAGSGAIIWPKGILSNVRGMRFKRPDGKQVRPDVVGADDIQTDQSAASPQQNAKRISALKKQIMRLAGHKKRIALFINATIIEPDDAIDQLSDPKQHPGIRTLKVPMLKSYSTAQETHWLGKYAELRTSFNPDDDDDRGRAEREANEYYAKHRKAMDAGAVASWESCYDHEHELSAIQHAYNIWIDTGEAAFMSECQNNPLREHTGLQILSADKICRKQSAFPRGQFPKECVALTTHIDIHEQIFYFQVWAFESNFTSYLIDEGCYPDQRRAYFAHRDPPQPLSKFYKNMSDEARIEQALDDFLHGAGEHPGHLARVWTRGDGQPHRIKAGLVDANGVYRDPIVKVLSRSPFSSIIRPAYGKGILAKHAPMSAWPKTREQKNVGPEWVNTEARVGEISGLLFDTNYWKTSFHKALCQPAGAQGSAHLWKDNPINHRLTGDHYASEKPDEVTVGSRTVQEFSLRPNCENHKLDNAIGCRVAASWAGISNLRRVAPRRKPKKRRTTYYG